MPFILHTYDPNTGNARFWDTSTSGFVDRAYPYGAVGVPWPPSGGVSYATLPDAATSGRLIQPGGGGGTIDLSQTPGITKVITSIVGGLNSLAAQDGLILARQYWPGAAATGGSGGLFVSVPTSTYSAADNVKIFAGSGCWWERQDCEVVTAAHAGCIRGDINPWRIFQNPQTQFAPLVLLADKFANLAAAKAWYPGARLNNPAKAERGESAATAFAGDLNSTALQHALTLYNVRIPAGVYRFNRPIEYFTNMDLRGEGLNRSIFVFESQNAFVPRRSSALAATNPQDEIYKFYVTITGIRCLGTAVSVPNNSDTQANVLDVAPFVEQRSGFYGARRATSGPEAQDANPLLQNCIFNQLAFDRWEGHGFMLANGFNNTIDKVDNNNNKGFGIHYLDGNNTTFRRCYTGRFNSRGGIWAEGGGLIVECTGYDQFDDTRPGIVSGTPGSVQATRTTLRGGNFEGVGKWGLQHHGDGGALIIDGLTMQYWVSNAENEPIRIYGAGNQIVLNFAQLGPCASSPITTPPSRLIMAFGNGNVIRATAPVNQGATTLAYTCVDAAGSPASFGYGNIPIRQTAVDIFNNATQYGLQVANQKPSIMERLWIGTGADVREFGTVSVASGLPTIAANPGLYLNINASATKANLLFAKTGTGTAGWLAVSIP